MYCAQCGSAMTANTSGCGQCGGKPKTDQAALGIDPKKLKELYKAPETISRKNQLMLMHLAGIFLFFVPGLIFWLLKRGNDQEFAEQAKSALNFQITYLLAAALFAAILVVVIAFVFKPAYLLGYLIPAGNIMMSGLAAMESGTGAQFRYPFALRIFK